jgi:hypothetical protein
MAELMYRVLPYAYVYCTRAGYIYAATGSG